MDFGYDAQQNRLSKTVTTAGVTKTSYYIRDAQGNALAVYERRGSSLIWKEQDLYGSSRLGMAKPEREMTGFFWQSASYTLVAGARSYELSNHLGNVLAVVSDRGELQSAQDYFPFGMAMAGRTSTEKYRYGFNGKETDPETGLNDFGARLYDSRLGRWLALDPLAKKYPALTPYNFVANTPLIAIDPNGKEIRIYYNNKRDYVIYQNGVLNSPNKDDKGNLVPLSLDVVNNKFVEDVKNSFDYLNASLTAKTLINKIAESTEMVVHIEVNSETRYSSGEVNSTIEYNPNSAINPEDAS